MSMENWKILTVFNVKKIKDCEARCEAVTAVVSEVFAGLPAWVVIVSSGGGGELVVTGYQTL